jgi:hypothetical protein
MGTTMPCSISWSTGRGGRDFLNRSDEGRPDLPRAGEGGLVGGLFANPAREPSDDQAAYLARSLARGIPARRKIES